MSESILGFGNYSVELDAGFLQDVFTLDDSDDGFLDVDFLDGESTFIDITEYVTNVSIKRGRNSQDEQFGAGTCVITIDDALAQDKFNVANTASPYWNEDRGRLGFEPRRQVRISRLNVTPVVDVEEYLFYGYIMKYDTVFDISDHNIVTVQAADGFSYLATTQLLPSSEWVSGVEEELSGIRVATVLGRPEINFPSDITPIIDDGVALLGEIEVSAQSPLSYINEIVNTAEQGRFYMSRKGELIFEERTPLYTTDTPIADFSDDGTGFSYDGLEVIYE